MAENPIHPMIMKDLDYIETARQHAKPARHIVHLIAWGGSWGYWSSYGFWWLRIGRLSITWLPHHDAWGRPR